MYYLLIDIIVVLCMLITKTAYINKNKMDLQKKMLSILYKCLRIFATQH